MYFSDGIDMPCRITFYSHPFVPVLCITFPGLGTLLRKNTTKRTLSSVWTLHVISRKFTREARTCNNVRKVWYTRIYYTQVYAFPLVCSKPTPVPPFQRTQPVQDLHQAKSINKNKAVRIKPVQLMLYLILLFMLCTGF